MIVVQDLPIARRRGAVHARTRSRPVLDNAKHMYFHPHVRSRDAGRLTVEGDVGVDLARRPGDLTTASCRSTLNPAGGVAVDVFLGNEELATVYRARLPFPGSNAPKPAQGPRAYWCSTAARQDAAGDAPLR